ncbi:hypothetical protein OG762_34150 [Streptomyces sp. NBC_01136]|uniref:JmjC domain-containing protein n=1 Tax=unclassified Streptomyces TaxID=2593676 RepID=UPI00324CCD91|nr:hypothetical protein OG762_34150 [Streptomyces sp. NBC_01136]
MPLGPLVDLLDLDGVDELLNSGIRRKGRVRMLRDGAAVDPAEFTWGEGAHRAPDEVRPSAVGRLLRAGATLALNDLQKAWTPLRELCGSLAHELGITVDAAAFLTPAGKAGFDYHHDGMPVMIAQTVGSKTWRLQPPVVADPLPHEIAVADEDLERIKKTPPVFQATLYPGDVLWIPTGWMHSGVATDEPSLHVSFVFRTVTRYWIATEVVSYLEQCLTGDDALRGELPWTGAKNRETLAAIVAEIVEEVADYLTRLDSAAVVGQVRERLRARANEAVRTPAGSLRASTVGVDTAVALAASSIHGVDLRDDGGLIIEMRDSRVAVGAPAAAFIASRWAEGMAEPWCARDLAPALGEQQAVDLVRRLLRSDALSLA